MWRPWHWRWHWPPWRRHRISIIVPFRSDQAHRALVWAWLHSYWRHALPEAQIIVSTNDETPFCKTAAVNAGFKKARGDIIVIMDADCFMDAEVIRDCARQIRDARKHGRKLWFIPYRRFYRLTQAFTGRLLMKDPQDPPPLGDPPPRAFVEHIFRNSSGHWWGALIQIMPREAFVLVGGMDERFKGWGGEDVSFMHALDTLYAKHKTADAPVYHFWHPSIKGNWQFTRQWENQPEPEMNDSLAGRYVHRRGDQRMMRELLDEVRNDPLSSGGQ